jgi:hypothetical protein
VGDRHKCCEVQRVTAIYTDSGLNEGSVCYLLEGVVCQHCVVVCPDTVSIVRGSCSSLKKCIPPDEIVDILAGRCELIVMSTIRAAVVRYVRVEVESALSV